MQIIVTSELKQKEYLWLTALTKKLSSEHADVMITLHQASRKQGDASDMEAVLEVTSAANRKVFEQLYQEEGSMLRGGLYDLVKDDMERMVKEQVEERVKVQLEERVKEQLEERVKEQVEKQVKEQVEKRLKEQSKKSDADRNHLIGMLKNGDMEGALAYLQNS